MGQATSREEKFWEACSYGREWLVKQMIEEGIGINWKSNIHDCYPIHAASQGKPEIVRLLIEAHCFVDAKDINDNTALHHAAMSGHVESVSLLLNAGASFNASNNQFWTPLTNAAYWNHPDVLKLLLDRGSDPFWKNKDGRNCLHELCRSKSENSEDLVTCCRLLISNMRKVEQANTSSQELPSHDNTGGLQPNGSMVSVVDCHSHVITDWVPMAAGDSVLELRSTQNTSWDSEADFTPLLFASFHGHEALVQLLLHLGANINVTDRNGWTCLHWAAQQNHIDVICTLLKGGANRRSKDQHGNMPYMVTRQLELADALRPDAYYPEILSNGAVSTDEEGPESDSEPNSPSPRRSICNGIGKANLAIDEISTGA